MEHESGDAYIRRFATFIRNNEKGLAQAAIVRNRRHRPASMESSSFLTYFSTAQPTKPVVLSMSTHHLFYLLIRLEALGINIGTLDVRVQSPSRPMSFVNIFQDSDKSDTMSLSSIRSSLSAMSTLSLGSGWWPASQESPLDDNLKYIYSSFTKIPALSITPPSRKMIQELANDPPNHNALPLDAFKNLQILEIADIDPRTLLGWDRLADSLISLKIRSSGVLDIADLFVTAVLSDQARRAESAPRPGAPASRRTSMFQPSSIPESVPEDEVEPSPGEVNHEDLASSLPSSKWSLLHSLSLPANELTFFPSSLLPLPPQPCIFTSLTALDLSSNLLVSVPPCLSSLIHLRTVNLADNMIDSVLHIYQNVGSIQSINLAKNRLQSICGLERLMALEVVDLRENYLEETSEIGRLATLPNIRSVMIESNPLTELEENYRIVCFELFAKEGKEVLLDGTSPGIMERRGMTGMKPSPQMSSSRPLSSMAFIPASPPTVAVGAPSKLKSTSPPLPPVDAASSSSPATSPTNSPQVQAVNSRPKKKRKVKRIVDLDGQESDVSSPSHRHNKHARKDTNLANQSTGSGAGNRETNPSGPAIPQYSHFALPKPLKEDITPKASQVNPPPTAVPQQPLPSPPKAGGRHARHQTEAYIPPQEDPTTPTQPSFRQGRNTLGSRSSKRRARVTASVYEPAYSGDHEESRGEEIQDSAEAYRRRIEALKRDMGEGWLRVFTSQEASKV